MRRRSLSRRSFLARAAGGVVAAGGALATFIETGAAHPISDNDPADGVGTGRSGARWPYSDTDQGRSSDAVGRAGRLGHYSDNDRGPAADQRGHGRQISDGDSTDRSNYRPTISDGDTGQYRDPPNRGRRPPRR